MMDRKAVALDNEILRGVVGSTAHGTAIDGQDDRDEMGVFVGPPEAVCGLDQVDHYIYRTQPEGVRSGPGDLDLTMYSLRKFCRLARDGNPTILVLLWLPEHLTVSGVGADLLALRDAFVSKEAGTRFLGYLVSQRMKLTGEKSKTVNRPDLVERYGYDTKFAMHALRLGYQGIEYMRTGRITMPVPRPELSTLRSVRSGQATYAEALALIEDSEKRLRWLVGDSRQTADVRRINRFLVEAHRKHWG